MDLVKKFDELVKKHQELQNVLATQQDLTREDYVRLSKEFTELNQIVKAVEIYRGTQSEIRDLESILNDLNADSTSM